MYTEVQHAYNTNNMSVLSGFSKSERSKGKLFVLSGPGGVGKTTVGNYVASRNDTVWRSISATTRNPRPGEVPGFDYYFVSDADFKAKFRNSEFLEYAQVHGNWYGTLRAPVEEKLKRGMHVLLVIDVHGGLTVKQNYEDAVLIFLQPPDEETLRRRMLKRHVDNELAIETRMRDAKKEMQIGTEYYDYIVTNDELETAISEVEKIISQ